MEFRGVRSGHVCTRNFEVLARATADGRKRPDHPIIVLPANTDYPEAWSDVDLMKQYAARIVFEIFGV